jgi:dihydrofolate reductase
MAMRKLTYAMGVSLDGYIADRDGNFDWAAPDAELHAFHNQQALQTGVNLYGRRLYETMRFWAGVDEQTSDSPVMLEWAETWKATPQVVFSTTLEAVEGNARLVSENVVEEVAALKQEDGKDIAVGGAGIAATLIEAGLVDEYGLFVNPVVVGGGTPFFPRLEQPLGLELVETRTFGSAVVYVRYRRA